MRSQLLRLALACARHAPADVRVRDFARLLLHDFARLLLQCRLRMPLHPCRPRVNAAFIVFLRGLADSALGINVWGAVLQLTHVTTIHRPFVTPRLPFCTISVLKNKNARVGAMPAVTCGGTSADRRLEGLDGLILANNL